MVTFKLIRETDELLVYLYYPEGRENTRPGVIEVNLRKKSILWKWQKGIASAIFRRKN